MGSLGLSGDDAVGRQLSNDHNKGWAAWGRTAKSCCTSGARVGWRLPRSVAAGCTCTASCKTDVQGDQQTEGQEKLQ